jgi:alpha-glucosidase
MIDQAHHDGSALYVSDLAPSLGDQVSVWVRAPRARRLDRVLVRYVHDGEPRYRAAVVDRASDLEVWWRADLELRNPVTPYRFLLGGAGGVSWLTAAGEFSFDVPDTTDFRLVTWAPPPSWALDAVVYEIFPDRFARSTGAATRTLPDWAIPCDWDTPVVPHGPETPYQLYGGDLDGITEHLDHIEALGANVVYLTPVFPARSNHRYDAAAFDRVDPLLGGDDALARLTTQAHGRSLRVIGDLTTNHCGDAHDWFRAAAADPGAAEREMFYFDGDRYESWYGVSSLPKLNWGSGELRRRFLGSGETDSAPAVVDRWLREPYALDGWRVDVANMTGRRAADSYTHEVAARLRAAAARVRPEALVVAEHCYDASGDLDRDGWHGTMNYAGFSRPLWSWLGADRAPTDFLGPAGLVRRGGAAMQASLRWFAAGMSWRSLTHSWTLLGSHDTPRVASLLGDARMVEVALGLQMAYPGTPMVFAGDEFGLHGVNGEDARRPIPWGEPTLSMYRDLIQVRRGTHALRHGGLRWVHADDDALVFLRESSDERVLVCARRAQGKPIELTGVVAQTVEVLHGDAPTEVSPDGTLRLPGDGPAVHIWRLPEP